MTLESYTSCGDHQEPIWWKDRCKRCDHGLMVHRTVQINDDADNPVYTMICDMCALAADTALALREYVADVIRRNGGHV